MFYAVLSIGAMNAYPNTTIINYILNNINKLLAAGITPIIVVDGKAPPSKSEAVDIRSK